MKKSIKIISIILILAIFKLGCTSTKIIPKEEVIFTNYTIIELILKDGSQVRFDNFGGTYSPEKNAIIGNNSFNIYKEVPIEDVLYAKVEKTDAGKTALAVAGTLASAFVLFILFIAILLGGSGSHSCPYIYSHNGEKFVLDAEPLGGAFSKSLQRTDYAKLNQLKTTDKNLKIKITNENHEKQYIDEVKIIAAIHEEGSEVFGDYNKNLYCISEIQAPVKATNENNENILNFFKDRDDICWQSYMSPDSNDFKTVHKHSLTLEFNKPNNVNTAFILVRSASTQWGTSMLGEYLNLFGEQKNKIYEGKELFSKQVDLMKKSETYFLELKIDENGTYKNQGWIHSVGWVQDYKVFKVDLTNIKGDKLKINLTPAFSFWSIDYVGVSFKESKLIETFEMPFTEAKDFKNNDLTKKIAKTDNDYYEMQTNDDFAECNLILNKKVDANKRVSYFLKISGYYEIINDKPEKSNFTLLNEFKKNPDSIIDYSKTCFIDLLKCYNYK